jgi:hypothetical protein
VGGSGTSGAIVAKAATPPVSASTPIAAARASGGTWREDGLESIDIQKPAAV